MLYLGNHIWIAKQFMNSADHVLSCCRNGGKLKTRHTHSSTCYTYSLWQGNKALQVQIRPLLGANLYSFRKFYRLYYLQTKLRTDYQQEISWQNLIVRFFRLFCIPFAWYGKEIGHLKNASIIQLSIHQIILTIITSNAIR